MGTVSTIVFFHAHPDDEAIFTGGTMLALQRAGHRVVLVVATSGELGVRPPGTDGCLGDVRRRETERACALLGVERLDFLGYHDSGMAAEATDPLAFCSADLADASGRLAALLTDENAAALVIYDERGVYGHPDHVQVHTVGLAAAALAGVDTVYESTIDGEWLHFVEEHLIDSARPAGSERRSVGVPSVLVTTALDVRDSAAVKRAALAAHESQIADASWALNMPEATFAEVYGYEFYVRRGPLGPIDALQPV